MHDPMTVAFTIRSPVGHDSFNGKKYYPALVTIWHHDPERDGSDDSCGWFMRGRHLSQADRDLARDLITNEYDNIKSWFTGRDDEERVSHLIGSFAALRRRERPWWRHPRWHVWHWRIQIHPWQTLRRRLLTRCALCGNRFKWGESPTSIGWNTPRLRWFRGEEGCFHSECCGIYVAKQSSTVQ